MAKQKKPTRYLSGKVEMKATFSQLRDKNETRGPGQIGQLKRPVTVRIGKVKQEEVIKRLALAESILNTGKVPASVKGGTAKTKDATAVGREKALQKELDAALARIEELEAYAKPDADPPAEPETPTPDPDPVPDATDPVDPAQE